MNVLDYTRTPLLTIFDHVRREAERRGVAVLRSEIVGLAPAAALPDDPAAAIKLSDAGDKILEKRLGL
jgi:glutamate formiminotransferase